MHASNSQAIPRPLTASHDNAYKQELLMEAMKGFSKLAMLGLTLVTLLSFAVPAYSVASIETIHFNNATQILPFGNPCSGVAGVFTITYDGVAHVTNDSVGGTHAT